MEEKDDLYLRALQYGKKHETFSLIDIAHNLNLTDKQKSRLYRQINNYDIFHYAGLKGQYQEAGELSMSVEDTFRLLEYTELKEARRSSKIATYFASAALVISIISTLTSIYYSHKSMEAKTAIPIKQGSTTKK